MVCLSLQAAADRNYPAAGQQQGSQKQWATAF